MDLEKLKGKLIVSCQALDDEPLHSSFIMGRMALAAKAGGASGIRAQSVEDIKEIQKQVDLPIIGIIKKNYPDSEVYITPTKKEIDVARAIPLIPISFESKRARTTLIPTINTEFMTGVLLSPRE